MKFSIFLGRLEEDNFKKNGNTTKGTNDDMEILALLLIGSYS